MPLPFSKWVFKTKSDLPPDKATGLAKFPVSVRPHLHLSRASKVGSRSAKVEGGRRNPLIPQIPCEVIFSCGWVVIKVHLSVKGSKWWQAFLYQLLVASLALREGGAGMEKEVNRWGRKRVSCAAAEEVEGNYSHQREKKYRGPGRRWTHVASLWTTRTWELRHSCHSSRYINWVVYL